MWVQTVQSRDLYPIRKTPQMGCLRTRQNATRFWRDRRLRRRRPQPRSHYSRALGEGSDPGPGIQILNLRCLMACYITYSKGRREASFRPSVPSSIRPSVRSSMGPVMVCLL